MGRGDVPRYEALTRTLFVGGELLVGSPVGAMHRSFDPSANRWSEEELDGAPDGLRTSWTGQGTFMMTPPIAAGSAAVCTALGASYDVTSHQWTTYDTRVASPRIPGVSAFTGSELLVWGGRSTASGAVTDPARILGDGFAFVPALGCVRPLSAEGAPGPRWEAASVWTGDRFFVWGGAREAALHPEAMLNDGGIYDPASDTWTAVASAGAPSPRLRPYVHWTGRYVVVWGGNNDRIHDGARYDLDQGLWLPMAAPPEALNFARMDGRGRYLMVSAPAGARGAAVITGGCGQRIPGGPICDRTGGATRTFFSNTGAMITPPRSLTR